ncbi:hypothetical protein KY285_033451 [Solanum tuberosum]|nr:hypothetical protein KY285_033451 [Solanum tuberosum]
MRLLTLIISLLLLLFLPTLQLVLLKLPALHLKISLLLCLHHLLFLLCLHISFYCASFFHCASTLSSTVPPPSPSIVSHSSTMPPLSHSTVPFSSSVPSANPIIDNDPTDDEVADELGSEGDTNEDTEVNSDVYQEYIDIRTRKRHFKRSQRRSRNTTSDQINVDEKGPDIGYNETNIGIRESLVGKLGGDEPYYLSDKAPTFEIDDEIGWGDGEEVDQVVQKPVRRKKTSNRVVFDATSEKIV